MITPSFSLTATERVLPKLALDFTTATLDSRITFTRTGATATCVASNGYVASVAADTPRFDYDPVTLICKGLLIEESRTNLLLYSEQLDNAAWAKGSAVTITADNITSPDGTVNADKIVAVGTTFAENYVRQQISSGDPNGKTYTFSIWLKADSIANVDVRLSNYADGDGTTTTCALTTSWQRITITRTFSTSSIGLRATLIYQASPATIYAWGAQIELGAFATSYIPTTSAALTRNADVATMTGTNFSDWFNAGNGAFGCSVLPKAASGVKPVLQCDDATALNTIVMQGNATATEMKITTLAVLQNTLSTGTITANAQYGLCGAWSAGSDALSKSGASPATGSPLTIPTVTQARLGSDGTNYFNGWLKKINYWPMRVTNSETQAFSK